MREKAQANPPSSSRAASSSAARARVDIWGSSFTGGAPCYSRSKGGVYPTPHTRHHRPNGSCRQVKSQLSAAVSQRRDDLPVGRGEGVAIHLVQPDPGPIDAAQCLRLAGEVLAGKHVERDLKVGIGVLDRRHLLAHCDLKAEFLPNLALKASRERFAALALAALKFPQPAHHLVERALRDQDAA